MRNVIQRIRYAATAFHPLDWMVITDEYPPEAIGGAEISLHEVLSSLPVETGRGLVVKYTGNSDAVSTYRYEGVQVLVLPKQANWRAPGLTPAAYQRVLSWGRPRWLFYTAQAVNLLARFGLDAGRRAALRMSFGKAPAGGVLTDHLPETFHLQAHALNTLIATARPATVIANNTRSIMAGHHAHRLDPETWRGVHRVAMVRDNRFYCARANQIGRVNGRDCITCTRDCAAADAGKSRESLQRRLLKKTAAARREALANYDEITVTSGFLSRQITRVTEGRVPTMVPNCVGDPHRIYDAISDVAQRPKPILLVIGSINEAKGQLEFLQSAIPHLNKNKIINIHFAGKGPRLKEKIIDICKINQILLQVKFLGFLERESLYSAIREATVVVLPTLWEEPFGRVPLEAAACGRPVVAFAGGGLTELVKDEQTGLLAPKGDYAALWRAIHRLLADGTLRAHLSAAAQDDLGARFDREQCVSAFVRLIRPHAGSAASGTENLRDAGALSEKG